MENKQLIGQFADFLQKEVFAKLVVSKRDFKVSQDLLQEFRERFVDGGQD